MRPAAVLGLLRLALLDLEGEVVGVVLVEDGQHALDHLPRGVVLDRLDNRHQAHTESLQRRLHRQVIASVAGEAVELVHDDHVHIPALCNALHHFTQGGAVGVARGLPRLDVLVREAPSLFGHEAQDDLTLRRDRQAFVTAVPLGLLGARHPEVRERTHSHRLLSRNSRGRGRQSRPRDAAGRWTMRADRMRNGGTVACTSARTSRAMSTMTRAKSRRLASTTASREAPEDGSRSSSSGAHPSASRTSRGTPAPALRRGGLQAVVGTVRRSSRLGACLHRNVPPV